ncbi:unnamed protein product [Acanthoscelides obtectus]|uniref:DDE Tnp4 domain-containing protein n=2 Tax=Acanthoscelides obtectus TaxID=200917 RepID=A0A9P0MES0_ACAOB|nr:unnamed protein product [Acanthoscelides obtectus]CAK1684779.1 Protein ANTAGONIST OF LIKE HETEROCHROMATIN PROTEIN 1 [Acanthoscelides obtectus]
MFLSTFSGEDSYNGLRRLFVCVLFSRADENMEEAVALHYMSVNYYYLLHLYGYQVQSSMNKRRRRRWWMTTIHRNRTITGMERLLSELTAESGIEFPGFLRMSTSDFEILLQKLAPLITKKDTKFRKAIPAKVRLAITLRYLATGDDFRSLHYLFKISHQLISKIVHEVCASILIVLKDEVMMPSNEEEWLQKETEFHDIFPHCIGSIDGKHVQILSPIHSGTEFYNYKHTFSIVLMALVDKKYRFLYADVGCQGRISDGGVFRNTALFEILERNALKIPAPSVLPGTDFIMPFVFVADNAFPLQTHIMKPYPGDHPEGSIKRKFNTQLSKARIVVENVFGIMSAVFRVLRKPIALQPDRASNVVMSCILLHNFLRNSSSSTNIYIYHQVLRTLLQMDK